MLDELQPVAREMSVALVGDAPRADLLADQCGEALWQRVVEVAAEPVGHLELAQRLAERGVMPMFGFPTRERPLYTSAPWRRDAREPLSRDMDIAISEFAPGNELVQDKAQHVVVGLVHYDRRGRVLPAPEGLLIEAAVCTSCSAAHLERIGESCSVCGATDDAYRRMQVAQPLGFRTSYWPRDYNGRRGSRTFATRPRLAVATGLDWTRVGDLQFSGGKADLVSVNDNRGRGFRYGQFSREAPYSFGEGLISLDLLDNSGMAARAGLSKLRDTSPLVEMTVSLGSVRATDVLRITTARTPPEAEVDVVRSIAARSAWTSLAFLLRNAAARLLDVGVDEPITEISPRALEGGGVVGEVFLADRLENGAGYATWLSRNMDELMAAAREVTEEHVAHASSGCDGSCYDCLRDYSNAAYHPMLDWFLAKEALGLLTGRAGPARRSLATGDGVLLRRVRWELTDQTPGIRVMRSVRDERFLVVAHPLLRTGREPAMSLADVAKRHVDRDLQVTNAYELARRPGLVESRARAGTLPRLG